TVYPFHEHPVDPAIDRAAGPALRRRRDRVCPARRAHHRAPADRRFDRRRIPLRRTTRARRGPVSSAGALMDEIRELLKIPLLFLVVGYVFTIAVETPVLMIGLA